MVKLIIRRVIEVIGGMILLSAAVSALNFLGIYKGQTVVFFVSLGTAAAYIGWTVFCLYRFRLVFDGKKTYFLVNVPIYLVMYAAAILTGSFDTEPVYTFMFLPFKLIHFLAKIWRFPGAGRIDRPISALIVSLIITIPVIIVPFYLSTDRKRYYDEVRE